MPKTIYFYPDQPADTDDGLDVIVDGTDGSESESQTNQEEDEEEAFPEN